jgi:cytochrome c-type biogenesis protein CcmH/NrfF
LLIWLLPVLALLAGFAVIVVVLRRADHQPRLEATDDDEALVARARTTEAHG